MVAAAMKHIASNFSKLDKFEEIDFRRWQKKMHFLLSSMSVVYVLNTLIPQDGGDDATVEQIRKRAKLDNDDYVYIDFKHTLKHLKEELTLELDSHLRIEESLMVQDSDKLKGNNVVGPLVVNMVDHNNSSKYNDNKGKSKHHDNTKVDPNKKSKVTCWKCGKPGHLKKDCKCGKVGNKANGLVDSRATIHVCKDRCWFKTYESLNDGSILYMRNESTALVHGRGYVDLRLDIVNDNTASAFMSTSNLNDLILWHARIGHVYFKRIQDMSKDGLIPAFNMDTKNVDSRATIHVCKDRCWFKTYESLNDGSILYMRNESTALVHGRGYVDLRLDIVNDNTASAFMSTSNLNDLILWHARIGHVYFKRIQDMSKDGLIPAFNMDTKNTDVKITFLNSKLYEEVYMNQPRGFIMPGNENKVNLTNEFLLLKFSMKDMGDADVILGIRIKHESNGIEISQSYYYKKVLKKLNYFDCTPVSTPIDTSEKLMPNNGQAVSQLKYSGVIGCLIYAMTCTRSDITFVVGKLSRYTSNPSTQYWQAIQWVLKYLKKMIDYRLTYTGYPSVLEGYIDAIWISNTEDNSSTSNWVFLLGGGAISWASKKQTCITGSTMKSNFVALVAAGKEADWLRNLILEIPLWSKPIEPISIRCDSAATLAKAYSQMYNEKSRHLGVRHSMIRERLTNGVVSIEFVRS
nr:zinc finger, CCHC-type [Tanacetum cinerariifolium]